MLCFSCSHGRRACSWDVDGGRLSLSHFDRILMGKKKGKKIFSSLIFFMKIHMGFAAGKERERKLRCSRQSMQHGLMHSLTS